DAKGWHIAHDIPVLESCTPIFFCVSASPWKSRSPIRTCSRKTSSNTLSCSGVCLSLWAAAWKATKQSTASAAPAEIHICRVISWPFSVVQARLLDAAGNGRGLGICQPRMQDLVAVIPASRIRRRGGVDVLAPHHVLVVHLAGAVHPQRRPADAVEIVAWVDPHHALGELGHALGRVGPGPGRRERADGA